MIVNLPEQGQLVSVRQRRYVVTEVGKSTLPDRPLRIGGNGPQHLVTMSSVEDDALGEELQVIWEIEPGAQVIEKIALPEPTGFDDPRRLDAFLDAVADSRFLFLSSANLTEYASSINMELGILVAGGPLPQQVEAQSDTLIGNGMLLRV
jgi:hypothetical protein